MTASSSALDDDDAEKDERIGKKRYGKLPVVDGILGFRASDEAGSDANAETPSAQAPHEQSARNNQTTFCRLIVRPFVCVFILATRITRAVSSFCCLSFVVVDNFP